MTNGPPEAPWYETGLRFTCTQCGNCCSGQPGYVWVTPDEIDAIADELGISAQECTARHTRSAGRSRSLRERRNGDCTFLERRPDGKTGCMIYRARPVQCRTWPFWKSNLESVETWMAAARDCPGMNQGEHHPLPIIQAAVASNGSRPL